MATVLKTVGVKAPAGSNPAFSAISIWTRKGHTGFTTILIVLTSPGRC